VYGVFFSLLLLTVGITVQGQCCVTTCLRSVLPTFSLDLAVFWILCEDLQGFSHAVSYRGKEEKVRFQN